MDKQFLKNKLNFFRFLTLKLSRGDVYPHFIFIEKFSRAEIMKLWENYSQQVKTRQIYKNLGMFIKIPYCQSKCFYCQCFSKPENNQAKIAAYVDYLIKEMEDYAPLFRGIKLDSLYFGGGTPSILSHKQLVNLFACFYRNFELEKASQVNFEATPYSLDEAKIKLLKKFGINRLTLGVQTLDSKVLQLNCRQQQNEATVNEVVRLIRHYKIKSLNIDLIGGLYGQSFNSFMISLRKVIALKPEMIHIYPFSAAPETLFSQAGKKMDAQALKLRHRMIARGNELILKSGYQEIKNDSYGKSLADRNKQEADNVEVNASILALGDRARGHILGSLNYEILEGRGKEYAKGIRLDLDDEVTKYLIYNLRNDIDLAKILEIFPVYSLKDLKTKLKYLILFKKVIWTPKAIISRIKTRQEQLIYSKFLYKASYLNKLAEYYAKSFSPAKDYSSRVNYIIDEIQ